MNQQPMFRLACIMLLSAFFIIEETQAQSIATDRPDQTESSLVVGNKQLQIEAGWQFNGPSLETSRTDVQNTLLRYGLFENFELRFVHDLERYTYNGRSDLAFGDISAGFKLKLLGMPGDGTHVSLLGHVDFPSGSYNNGNRLGTTSRLLVSHDLTDNATLGYNVGYVSYGSGKGDMIGTLSLGWGLNSKFAMYVEVFGDYVGMEEAVLNSDLGVTYLVNNDFQLDWSFGFGLSQKMNYMALGASYRIKRP